MVIGPPGKKRGKKLIYKKEQTPNKATGMSDTTLQEKDFTVAITDGLDDDFDDGDESGLEEEIEVDQDQDHTIDTNKIANKIAKRYSNFRKGKKSQLKVTSFL